MEVFSSIRDKIRYLDPGAKKIRAALNKIPHTKSQSHISYSEWSDLMRSLDIVISEEEFLYCKKK